MGSICVLPSPLAALKAIFPIFFIIIFMRLKSSMNSDACFSDLPDPLAIRLEGGREGEGGKGRERGR
jgi:hypothetical protein